MIIKINQPECSSTGVFFLNVFHMGWAEGVYGYLKENHNFKIKVLLEPQKPSIRTAAAHQRVSSPARACLTGCSVRASQ